MAFRWSLICEDSRRSPSCRCPQPLDALRSRSYGQASGRGIACRLTSDVLPTACATEARVRDCLLGRRCSARRVAAERRHGARVGSDRQKGLSTFRLARATRGRRGSWRARQRTLSRSAAGVRDRLLGGDKAAGLRRISRFPPLRKDGGTLER